MKKLLSLMGVAGVLVTVTAVCSTVLAADVPQQKGRVFELRTYVTHPGKLPDLHKRFRDHTCRLFQKHGVEMIGFWVPLDKPDTLTYLIAFPSVEAQKKAWQEFRDDPEWKKAFAESHKNGIIVKEVQTTTMTPTDYSKLR